jgi:hypothetical protein
MATKDDPKATDKTTESRQAGAGKSAEGRDADPVPRQELAPTHPSDPTATTLEEPDAAVTDETIKAAEEARLGYAAEPEPPASRAS